MENNEIENMLNALDYRLKALALSCIALYIFTFLLLTR